MAKSDIRRVLALINPRSGTHWSFNAMRSEMDRLWDVPGIELTYQFCQTHEDTSSKTRRAIEQNVDTIIVVGGDGTVSAVGRELVGSSVSLGVVPVGSGNGFARHFGIPLSPARAVRALRSSSVRRIDVGVVDNRPFLVTCSMAWDASIVRSFDKMPVRGILPYIFAGVNEFIGYKPQEIEVVVDSREKLVIPDPLFFTVANLTQYGGGARIAPHAKPDDGLLELVLARHQDMPTLVANCARFFDGSIQMVSEVVFRRFQSLKVKRRHHAQIQVDGELVDAAAEIEVRVRPDSLNVLVPND